MKWLFLVKGTCVTLIETNKLLLLYDLCPLLLLLLQLIRELRVRGTQAALKLAHSEKDFHDAMEQYLNVRWWWQG